MIKRTRDSHNAYFRKVKIRFCILVFICIYLFACSSSRNGRLFQTVPEQDIRTAYIADSLLNVELSYIGAIGHSYIFECYIENSSARPITIDQSQFSLVLHDATVYQTIDTEYVISELRDDRKNLKQWKKSSTILGGVLIGIGIIAGTTQGANAAETLAFSVDPVVGVLEDRAWYDRNIESLDDEVTYLRNAQFEYHTIAPNEHLVKDVLFPTIKIKNDIEVHLDIAGTSYIFSFDRSSFR